MGRSLIVGVLFLAACGGSDGGTPYTLPPMTYDGSIAVRVAPKMPGVTALEYRADGYFLDYAGKPHAPDGFTRDGHRSHDCQKFEDGTCTLITCTVDMDASVTLDQPKYDAGGTITVTRSSGPTLTIMPSTEGYYNGMLDNSTAATTAETVKITSSGDAVPAFDATLPLATASVQTMPTPNAALMVASNQDVKIAWTGGGSEKVRVSLANSPDMDGQAALTCSFFTSAGQGVLPAKLLSHLPEWSPGWIVTFGDEPTLRTVGNWPVQLSAIYQPMLNVPSGFTLVVN